MENYIADSDLTTAVVETLNTEPTVFITNNLEFQDDPLDDHEPPRDGPSRVWCYDEPDM